MEQKPTSARILLDFAMGDNLLSARPLFSFSNISGLVFNGSILALPVRLIVDPGIVSVNSKFNSLVVVVDVRIMK